MKPKIILYNPWSNASGKMILPMSLLAVGAVHRLHDQSLTLALDKESLFACHLHRVSSAPSPGLRMPKKQLDGMVHVRGAREYMQSHLPEIRSIG